MLVSLVVGFRGREEIDTPSAQRLTHAPQWRIGAVSVKKTLTLSNRAPGEHVVGPVEQEKTGAQHRQVRVDHALRRPAFAAVRVTNRPRLAEQVDLVVAHVEDLAAHILRLVGTQADDEGRDALGHQLLQVTAINWFGPLHMTHAVAQGLAARKSGRIVNIASDAGCVGSSGEVVSSGCKGATIAFAKALAREVARAGVDRAARAPDPNRSGLRTRRTLRASRRRATARPCRGQSKPASLARPGDHVRGAVGAGTTWFARAPASNGKPGSAPQHA
ncbi:MAG: SDR family NAD(P)-dependent oxidoreductase [Bacteriovorax sp.]|nr:SDR family NAD(P)-dependent oxidoreductase [Rhizobacter sp.]